MEKYIEDARQDEKHVPDLLQWIIQPPGLVKEELRTFCSKLINLDTKNDENGRNSANTHPHPDFLTGN